MTEQTSSPAPVETTTSAVESPQPQSDTPKEKRSTPLLGAVAIVLIIALGGGLYYHSTLQAQAQSATNSALQAQLAELKLGQQQEQQQQAELKQQQVELIKQQSQALANAEQQRAAMTRQLAELQDKVAGISGSDANTWMLAQADFLVKLAGRKLWSDLDVTTAAALLKNADASLAEMNDPSLIEVRRAITEDIGSLAAVSQVDFDGIILKLNQLSNQIDNLRLADTVNNDGSPMDTDGGELSSSLTEWRQNLTKSWHNFMADFITIRRRDSAAEPLLAPNQDIYLRENIRARLLVAAQAVPRHQNEIYKQSLEIVSTWVRAYFDANDPSTKAFLEELDGLSQQSISMDVPSSLQSQPLLEKLMQTRVRNLLAQTPAANQEG